MKNLLKSIASDFSHWNTKMICRAGVIAALYAALTWAFGLGGGLAYGPFQIRPTEALTILPLFFPESIPALYIGCMLANIISIYNVYDIFLGSLATLFAAFLTYLCGKIFNNRVLQVGIGGIWPVILNAFIIPAVWILAGQSDVVYWYQFASMIITQSVWVYALGIPLYIAIYNLRKRGVRVFTSPVHAVQSTGASTQADMGGAQNGGGLPKDGGDNAR